MRTIRIRLLVLAVAVVSLAAATQAQKSRKYDRLELTNLLLGPDYSQWLVGPIARIASDSERQSFLELTDDTAAEQFVQSFWSSRESIRGLFEERAVEADKRYTEGTFVGSRTDRGTIYVLYGDPASSEYEEHRNIDDPDVERWVYEKSAPKGLDGKKPRRQYRFAKEGEVTAFFVDTGVDRRRRELEQRLEPSRTRRPF